MSTEQQVADAVGAPVEKVVDVAIPPTPTEEKKESDNSDQTDKGEPSAEKGGGPEELAPPAVPTEAPTKPDRLQRAKEAARQRYLAAEQRRLAMAEAQRQAAEAQRLAQLAHRERQQREIAEKQLQTISRDPMAALAFLEQTGLDAKTLTQKAIEANSPEAKLKAELNAEWEQRFLRLQQSYDERLAEIQQREQAAQQAAAHRHAQERFIQEAADATKFPAVAQLVELGPEWKASLLEEATRILIQAHQRTGQEYTNDEVLSYLEKKYSRAFQPKNGTSQSKAGTEATKESNGTGTTKSEAGGSRTLTNKDTAAKGSLPPNFDDLPDKEQKKALAAMLRQMSRG